MKISLSVKIVVALNFMCSIINFFFISNILQFVTYKMAILSKIKLHSDAVSYFKEIPFYNKSIKKPKAKRLKNIHRLAELPFYEQLIVIKTDQAFRGYGMSYKVEIVERKDPIVELKGVNQVLKICLMIF